MRIMKNSINKEMDSINNWMQKEQSNRKYVALTSEEHENEICPICGRQIEEREGSNGMPLVDACVCYDCDKRYVFPFRLRSGQIPDKEFNNVAWQNYLICMQAELLIETTNKIKSLHTNHSDVA